MISKSTVGIAVVLCGLGIVVFALLAMRNERSLTAEVEKLRDQGAIVENYHRLREQKARRRWPWSVPSTCLLTGLIALAGGAYLISQGQRVPSQQH